jgi:hypothetical protein
MCNVYVFEGRVVKYAKDMYTTYPPREYQLKLRRFHGKRVKVVVIESG